MANYVLHGANKLKSAMLLENSIIAVANEISKTLNRRLSEIEIRSLRSMIEQLPITAFSGYNERTIIPRIADLFNSRKAPADTWRDKYSVPDLHNYQVNELNNFAPAENPLKFSLHADRRGASMPQKLSSDPIGGVMSFIDRIIAGDKEAHEAVNSNYLQSIMIKSNYRTNELLQSFLGADNFKESLKRISNSLITYDNIALPRRTILLDSRNKAPTLESDLHWDLVPFATTGGKGQVIVLDTIQQIVEIRCAPFYMPIPVTNSNIMFYKKIRLSIEEFIAQSTITSISEDINRKIYYTFEYDVQVRDNYLFLTPVNVWKPNKVISQCSSITARFYAAERIILDSDRLNCTVTNSNPALVTTPVAHNIATGDLVYFSASNSTLLDRESGYFATVISATTFSVPIDLSSGTVSSAQVFFASKKISFELTFICLEH